MKKILIGLAMAVAAMAAFAEPSFDQVQTLIGQHQYAAAEQGLEQIIQNHPQSAKAFYAMAQAQAGLGHLDKAQFALNKAKGLDPTLKFASADNVKALELAIAPQVAKIEAVEPSHFWRNMFLFLIACGGFAGFAYMWSLRKKEHPGDDLAAFDMGTPHDIGAPKTTPQDSPNDNIYAPLRPTLRPSYPPMKHSYAAPIQSYPNPVPASPPIINNHYGSNSSGSDMLTGVLIGNMISNSGNHHDRIIEREVIVERPVYQSTPSYVPPASQIDKSWDDTPAKSSSWDDNSSKTDSSWSDNSSSSSSSSSSSDGGGSSDW
jgi:hypothetical protein